MWGYQAQNYRLHHHSKIKRNTIMKTKNTLKYVTFGIYIFLLAWLILFKLSSPAEVFFTHRGVNIIPFNISDDANALLQTKEIIYNSVVFVPFGMYLTMIFRGWSFQKRLFSALVLSIGFEIVQFAFALGISDITDLITNTLGALVGIFVYRLLSVLFKAKTDKVINVTVLIFEAFALGMFLLLTLANL